jgi:glycine/D-amino acid oxidase-like deaminating enzyme
MVAAIRPTPSAGSAGPWKHNVMATNGFHYLAQMPKQGHDPREGVVIYGLCEEHNNSDDTTLITNADAGLDAMAMFLGHVFPKKFSARDHCGRVTTDSLENVWSGLVGRTKDGKPVIGPVVGKKGQYTAAGYNGAGMSRCFLAGKCIADMMAWELGRQSGAETSAWKVPEYIPAWFLGHLDELRL